MSAAMSFVPNVEKPARGADCRHDIIASCGRVEGDNRAFLLFLGRRSSFGLFRLCGQRQRISGNLGVVFVLVRQRHVEFQLEIDRGVIEAADGVEGDDQLFRVSEKDRPISNWLSVTFSSQNWCWMTIVICSAYLAFRCCEIRTPGAPVRKVMKK